MSKENEEYAISSSNKATWSTFLKSIALFSGDLSAMTAPSFILSSTSLTEYTAYWAEHPFLLKDIAMEKEPQVRALLVLKWFIATLKGQYANRNENLGSEKVCRDILQSDSNTFFRSHLILF